MALSEESEIMAAIGFHSHYSWYNGSGSCRHIRIAASHKLDVELRRRGMTANPKMLRILERVAHSGEDSDYMLTNTWVCASYIIQAHIHRANGMSPESFNKVLTYLEERYKPKPTPGYYPRFNYERKRWL